MILLRCYIISSTYYRYTRIIRPSIVYYTMLFVNVVPPHRTKVVDAATTVALNGMMAYSYINRYVIATATTCNICAR